MKFKHIIFLLLPSFCFVLLLEGSSYIYYQHLYKNGFVVLDSIESYNKIDDLLTIKNYSNHGKVWYSNYYPTIYYSDYNSDLGRVISLNKSNNTLRLFSYGGSSTAGSPWGYPASFSRFLDDELNLIKKEGTSIEVMNFGSSGMGSSGVLSLVTQTIKYQPDILLIYSGHNELYDNNLFHMYMQKKITKIYYIFKHRFYTFKVGSFLFSQLMGKHYSKSMLDPQNSPLNQEIHLKKKMDRKFLADIYKSNLRKIVEIAQDHNVNVILISQPSNFFWVPSYSTDDKVLNFNLKNMENSFVEQKYDETKKYINYVLNIDNEASIAYYYSGLIYTKEHNYDKAKSAFLDSIEFDQNQQRATEEYKKILEKLAITYDNAYFVDAKEKFYNYSNDGLIDGTLIIDQMHPTIEGQKIIAYSIIENYFLKYENHQEILDNKLYDTHTIWSNNIDPNFYFNVCKRYYDTEDSSECIRKALINLQKGSVKEKRIASSVWEFLFYKSLFLLEEKNYSTAAKILKNSANIYPATSIKMISTTH